MKQQVREILAKLGPKGRQRLAAWHQNPGSHQWLVNGLVNALGEQYRTAADWLAGELDREAELAKDIADGMASNPTLTIRLFVRSVPDGLAQTSNHRDNSATVARLEQTVHNLEARITGMEEVMRSASTPSTVPAREVAWILDTLGYQSLAQVKSKPQRTRITELAQSWQGMAQRQVINNTLGEITDGLLKAKKGV